MSLDAGREENMCLQVSVKDISIVIVNWNAGKALGRCIRSILDGTAVGELEIIVVDNASTDSSVDQIQVCYPRVKVLRNSRNVGFASGCNMGIRIASGTYVAFINPDVIVERDCLAALRSYLDGNHDVGMVGPRVKNLDGSIQWSCKELPTLWSTLCRSLAIDTAFPTWHIFGQYLMRHWAHDRNRRVEVLSGCFWMVRRSAIQHVGMLDEQFFLYAEDKDWCRRFSQAGLGIVYIPAAGVIHEGGVSSRQILVEAYVQMLRANLQYWKKHHSRTSGVIYYATVLVHEMLRYVWLMARHTVRRDANEEGLDKCRTHRMGIRWLLGLYNGDPIGSGSATNTSTSQAHERQAR